MPIKVITLSEFERRLAAAENEATCDRLLRIDLANVACTVRQRDDLAGRAMYKRFHFAMTGEGTQGPGVFLQQPDCVPQLTP